MDLESKETSSSVRVDFQNWRAFSSPFPEIKVLTICNKYIKRSCKNNLAIKLQVYVAHIHAFTDSIVFNTSDKQAKGAKTKHRQSLQFIRKEKFTECQSQGILCNCFLDRYSNCDFCDLSLFLTTKNKLPFDSRRQFLNFEYES